MSSAPKIVCLTNVYDQSYHALRGEEIKPCLSWAKRRDLFHCLKAAAGRDLVVLSSPPKAENRRRWRWIRPIQTTFCGHPQFFCANLDAPKLRILLSWFFYTRHVLRQTRSGDLVIIDNYELIYVVAACFLRIFRRVTFILDYEDGKHITDVSFNRLFSGLAELLGRPLLRAAMVAHPALGRRLPAGLPVELVPGIASIPSPPLEERDGERRSPLSNPTNLDQGEEARPSPSPTTQRIEPEAGPLSSLGGEGWGEEAVSFPTSQPIHAQTDLVPEFRNPTAAGAQGVVRLLYSGTLDTARGVDLLLQSLEFLPASGWHLSITGAGDLSEEVKRLVSEPKWRNLVSWSSPLPEDAFARLLHETDVGLNCQRASDPVSNVTFPSKLFTYLSAGLLVVSSTASEAREICGKACIYYEEETPEALASALRSVIEGLASARQEVETEEFMRRYSAEGTTRRLRELIAKATPPESA